MTVAPAPNAAGIDLSDLDGFWAAPIEHRHAAFAQLRDRPGMPYFAEPAMGQPLPGRGYHAVTRRDDVIEISRRPEVFRSGSGIQVFDAVPEEREFLASMISLDDPRHARLRRIVSRGFTARHLAALTDNVHRITRQVVDDVTERAACDAVTDIAARLPLRVICDMMGVPASLHEFVFDRTNIILGPADPEYVAAGVSGIEAARLASAELAQMVFELAAQRAEHPADDVTSALISAEIGGERLTHAELAAFFILLVLAGNETTRNAISWGIQALTAYPEQRAIWLADLDAVTPTAVEEIVRWASPVIYMRRTAARDVEVGGQQMRAGDKAVLFYWAANRDPAHFTDPEAFNVRRDPNPHIGFGAPGPHFCLGAHLARLEITVMMRELLTRLPDIHATAEPDRLRSMFINGIKHLPVTFTPRPPAT